MKRTRGDIRSGARAARIAAGISTRQAARFGGVTPKYLTALERGEKTVRLALAIKLARLYEAKIDVFLPPYSSVHSLESGGSVNRAQTRGQGPGRGHASRPRGGAKER